MTTPATSTPASCRPDAVPSAAGALALIAANARSVQVKAGQRIFSMGDAANGCYLIVEGAVKVTVPLPGAQETLLAILGKGDVFGEMALLDRQPRSATVTAIRASRLCHVTSAMFDELSGTNAALSRELLRMIVGRLRAGNAQHAVQHLPLRVRLARAFVQLAQGFGHGLPDQRTLIRQKVSQAELGHMIGAARENVNRQLTEWQRAGLLSRISGYYCLERPMALEAIARGD